MPLKAFHLIDNQLLPLDISAASLDGITASLAEGFYTTFSTLAAGTKVLGLKSHLQRLYKPANAMSLNPSATEKFLREQVAKLTQENLPNESRIRIILTKDTGDVYIGIQLFEPLPKSVYQNGVHVISSAITRKKPRIKDTNFISQSNAQRKLLSKDIFEVLLTKDGKILEGMTSNFYAIVTPVIASRSLAKQSGLDTGREDPAPTRPAILITAQKGILLGVTRKAILKLARGQGMMIEYRAPKLNENFEEAFLTSSSRGVVPVVSIDDKSVGQGRVGMWTKKLLSAYQNYVKEKSEWVVQQ